MNPLLSAAGMVAPTVIPPCRPSGPGWRQLPMPNLPELRGSVAERWLHTAGYCVISAVEVAELGDLDQLVPHYHLSISRLNARSRKVERARSADALFVLGKFGLDGWHEDNHVPGGVVRNYWRPVADDHVGIRCACEATEPTIREDKGDFIWRPANDH